MQRLVYSLLLFSFFTVISLHVKAQQLTGIITDGETGEPLYASTITLSQSNAAKQKFNALTGLNGGFILKNMPVGEYKLAVNYVGYKEKNSIISIAVNIENITIRLQKTSVATQ